MQPGETPAVRSGESRWPEVRLPGFEGSLETRFQQVESGALDARAVPVGAAVRQVLEHLRSERELDLEQATAFLGLMARLLDTKTRALVPSEPEAAPPPADAGEPEGAGAEELVERLLAYRAFKEAAGLLRRYEAEQAQRFPSGGAEPAEHTLRSDDVGLEELLAAFQRIWERASALEPREIPRERLTVAKRMVDLVEALRAADGHLTFTALFAGEPSRREVVVTFLALLELVRQGRVRLRQEVAFGEISIRLEEGDGGERR